MKDSIVFYKSFYEAINTLPEENQLELYKAIFEYSFTGENIEIKNPISNAMFILMKPNIDSANARYNASVENGKRGGRPKKENLDKTQEKPKNNLEITQEKPKNNLEITQEKPKNNLNETQPKPNHKPSKNLNDNVDDNVDVDDNYNVDVNVNEKVNVKGEENANGIYTLNKELIDKYTEFIDPMMINIILQDCIKTGCTTQHYIKASFDNYLRNSPNPQNNFDNLPF